MNKLNILNSLKVNSTAFCRSTSTGLKILVDDREFVEFRHRLDPESVNSLFVNGRIKLYKIKYTSAEVKFCFI